MTSPDLEQYVGIFLEELDEQIQIIDEEILRLENNGPSEGGIQTLFRAAHTIKGSSAAMGFEAMKQLTHEMEHLLDRIRSNGIRINSTITNVLFRSLDTIKELKEGFALGQSDSMQAAPIIQELQKAREERQRRTFQIRVKLVEECEMKAARAAVIYNQLAQWGEVLAMKPALSEDQEANEDDLFTDLEFTFTGRVGEQEIADYISLMMDVKGVEITLSSPGEKNTSSEPVESWPKAQNVPLYEKHKHQTIRVNVERLEELMNLVGELVIDQTRIHQVKGNLLRKYKADDDVEELGQISDHISRIIGDLQESVMKARMLPIEQLFNRFPRMVRDLCQSLNKKVELILEGNETELDRTLIEEIGDPLIHLIRNAIDHGIEMPEERLRLEKTPGGQLTIRAFHQDNQVVITVEDDGAGIHPDKIKEAAVSKGMITREEAESLTDREAIHLIFHAGFSTAAKVSDVSGRGVGMDIVRSDIERLNGLIDIESEIGKGTRFTIRLPLTLAIITGLMVKISRKTFILPMGSVAEIVRIPADKIQTIRGNPVVVIRDQVIPLLYLHDYFGYPKELATGGQLSIVIAGSAEKRVALYVDELIGNQEIVIKSLGTFLGNVDFISGATILGDGKVALILDISCMLKMGK